MSLKQKPKLVNVSRSNLVSWIETGLRTVPGTIPSNWDVKDIDIYGLLTDINTGQKMINQNNFNIRITLEKQEVNTITNGEGTQKL